ncbi:MFS transporter [Nocardia sp. NPDC052001]|uniref:MFS transporter n=1 Tax=Nocardia sp. NPDC052001 TaxID=3154853 RepID=UPI003437733B
MRKWLPLLTVCLGTFMLLIDVTIVNVALPDMRTDLDASFGALQWVVDGYALAMAALMLGAGAIADLAGHRRTYLAGLALFATASLICGLAPNPTVLIAARIVQGIGAATMSCTTFALLNAAYAGRDRGAAYGMWGAVAGASSAIGPIIGGLLTEIASWRWIFFVNLPFSVLAIALCLLVLTEGERAQRNRIDLAGMAIFTASAATATYALIRANEHGWTNALTWWLLLGSAIALAAFVVIEIRTEQPILDLTLLRDRFFTGVLIAGATLYFAAFAALMYTQIWMQSSLGLTPIAAGAVGLPLSLMAFLVSGSLGKYLHGDNPGRIIGAGLALIALGGAIGALLVHGDASWPALIPGSLLVGAGVGLATATLSSAAMSAVPWHRAGMATGALNTAQQLSFALGIAALGGLFTHRTHHILDNPATTAAGVQLTLAVSGTIALLGALLTAFLMRRPKHYAVQNDSAGQMATAAGTRSR